MMSFPHGGSAHQDDVRGNADHQRGHGAEPARLPEQRLGPGLALRAADGQHAGREGPAAGHAEGDAGEPEPGAAAPAGRHLRPRLSAAPAQLRPAAANPNPLSANGSVTRADTLALNEALA